MKIVHTSADLDGLAPARRPDGAPGRRSVVMTMGALHDGHLALVRAAKARGDQVVVTIFVNPLQFNDPADLQRYPRTLAADCALLAPEGVDVVFAPDVEEMYPSGKPVVTVSAGVINSVFEGALRPGHFDGVLTVVLKLLNLTRPSVAFFGQKDAQQVIAVKAMVRDLSLPVEIATVPTVREPDGLALSSRNVFLSPDDRVAALALSAALGRAQELASAGARVDDVIAAGRAVLDDAQGVTPDYFAALDPLTSLPCDPDVTGEVILAVAATVGGTRLIDNVVTSIG